MRIPVSTPLVLTARPDPTTPGSYLVEDPSRHLLASGPDPLKALAERLAKFGCSNEQQFILLYADNSKPVVCSTVGAILNPTAKETK